MKGSKVVSMDKLNFASQLISTPDESFINRTVVQDLVKKSNLPPEYKRVISQAVTMVLNTSLNDTSKTVQNVFSDEFVKYGVAKSHGNIDRLDDKGLGKVAQLFFHELTQKCETNNEQLCPFTATKAYSNYVEPKINNIGKPFQDDPKKQWMVELQFQTELFNRLVALYSSTHGVHTNKETGKPHIEIYRTLEQDRRVARRIQRASYSLLLVFSILTTMTALHYRIPQRIGSAFRSMIHKFKSLMEKPEVTNALEEIQLSGGLQKHRDHDNFWTREAKEAFREVSGRNVPGFGSSSGHVRPASSRGSQAGSWSWPKLIEIERIPYEFTGKTGTKKKNSSTASQKSKSKSAPVRKSAPKVSATNFLKLPPQKRIEVLQKNKADAVTNKNLNAIIKTMKLQKTQGTVYRKANKAKLVLKALQKK